MKVTETFFSVGVRDMARATRFYVDAVGANVAYATGVWSSLMIAGVRVGLAHVPELAPGRVGLHFAVPDLAAARTDIERAGGTLGASIEVAPGVVIAEATDTEGNTFTLRQD